MLLMHTLITWQRRDQERSGYNIEMPYLRLHSLPSPIIPKTEDLREASKSMLEDLHSNIFQFNL